MLGAPVATLAPGINNATVTKTWIVPLNSLASLASTRMPPHNIFVLDRFSS